MDLFGARLRTDPVEEVRLLFKDVVEALTVDFELFTKLLPNEILWVDLDTVCVCVWCARITTKSRQSNPKIKKKIKINFNE